MTDAKDISAEEKAELVAFLDGEADETVADRLEARIAHSPSIREEARALRESFDLLEFLPMPRTTKDFTHKTVVFVEQDIQKSRAWWPSQRMILASWLLGFLAALAVGWWSVSRVPDPNLSLLEDLPVIERLQEYRASRGLEFLRALRDRHLLEKADTNRLPEPGGPPPNGRGPGPEGARP